MQAWLWRWCFRILTRVLYRERDALASQVGLRKANIGLRRELTLRVTG